MDEYENQECDDELTSRPSLVAEADVDGLKGPDGW